MKDTYNIQVVFWTFVLDITLDKETSQTLACFLVEAQVKCMYSDSFLPLLSSMSDRQ